MSTATDATPSPDESSAGLGAGHNQWDVLIVLIVVAGLVALTFLVVEIAPADAANILGVVAPVLAAVFGISIGAYAGKAVGKQQGRQQGKQEVKSQLQEPLQQLQAKTRTSADILQFLRDTVTDLESITAAVEEMGDLLPVAFAARACRSERSPLRSCGPGPSRMSRHPPGCFATSGETSWDCAAQGNGRARSTTCATGQRQRHQGRGPARSRRDACA